MEIIYKIYGLSSSEDPDNIRYIGYTKYNNLLKRLYQHNTESKRKNNYKCCWIRNVIKKGFQINIVLLEDNIINFEEANYKEIEYIKNFKLKGNKLTNSTDGGTTAPENFVKSIGRYKAKKIVQFSLFGDEIKEFNSMKEASEYLKISVSSISKSLHGNQLVKGEYIFAYYNETPRMVSDYKKNDRRVMPIIVHNVVSNEILKFKNTKEACKKLNLPTSTTRRYLISGKLFKNTYKLNYL